MDIYTLAQEIIQRTGPIKENYKEEFLKIKKFDNPLFKGYSISETCNPVSCRLIIFFTDTLIPYFINNINIQSDKITRKIISNFTAVFNFIFYLIFDKYEYNEKNWIVQQINTILKGLKQENIEFFKQDICISFEKVPLVKDIKNCNFIMKINSDDTYLNNNFLNNNFYYVDDMLLEELKKVLNRCLSFWEIHVKVAGVEDMDYTYRIDDDLTYDEIHFSPIIVLPDKIQIFPINKDTGTILFYLFSDYKALNYMISEDSKLDVNKKIAEIFKNSASIVKQINDRLNQIGITINHNAIDLIKKFISCSYIFLALQNYNVFPKNKKYPETYDEIFTMFSNNKDKDKITAIKNMIYTTPINQSYYDFFVPAVGMKKALSPPASSVILKPSSQPPFVVQSHVKVNPGGDAIIKKNSGGSIKKKIFKKPKKTIRNIK